MPYLLQVNNQRATVELYTQNVCAATFCVYTFVYLFFYQEDLLTMAQHVLSEGKTHYGRLIGAILITLTLYLLHLTVLRITQLKEPYHAFTYFPSLLTLTFITDVSPEIDTSFSLGGWWVALPLLLIVYAMLVLWLKKACSLKTEEHGVGFFTRSLWINLMVMAAMFLGVGLFSNGNDVFHYRMRIERLVQENDYQGAMKVGRRSLATDESLTMLRVYVLAHEGLLGEKLFHYPVEGGSASMLPDGETAKTMLLPDSLIRDYALSESARTDYRLTAYLLDCNLNAFAGLVQKAYPDSILPRHYAEALLMHRYYSGKPMPDGGDNVIEADLKGFREMEKQYPSRTVANYLRRTYGNTYWYYYKYVAKSKK